MRDLTERELDILRCRSIFPEQLIKRLKLLYQLDREFQFNRSELARYLKSQGLYGYSRRQIVRLIGNPVFNCYEYKQLLKLVEKGKLDSMVLELHCARRVQVKINRLITGEYRP